MPECAVHLPTGHSLLLSQLADNSHSLVQQSVRVAIGPHPRLTIRAQGDEFAMKSIDDRHSFSTADYLPRCLEGMFLGSRPRLLLVSTFAASVIASASREARP